MRMKKIAQKINDKNDKSPQVIELREYEHMIEIFICLFLSFSCWNIWGMNDVIHFP